MAGYPSRCGWLDQMSAQPAEQERALQELFEDLKSQPKKQNGPLVDKSTRLTRDRIWKLWEGFCHLTKRNSARPWEDFLLQRDTGIEAIQVFLIGYVRNSLQLRFVLDARERAKVRTVRNASTVVVVWRALVAAADFYIMEPKRQAQPKKARFWRLQWLHDVEGRLVGPGFKVVLWIYEELALNENLLLDSPYQKVAATPSAVRKILLNLWVKAAYIPCTPLTRLCVHVINLLSALGGFRPKSLRTMKFSQFQLAFITLPDGRTRLACEVRIARIKFKRRQKCNSKLSRWIVFTVMANPDPLFDLPDLIADLGIALNAFEADYTSPADLYARPLRETANYVPLKWKESMLDKYIVDICDTTLRKLWDRTCLVSGARDSPRYYCLRVGAGGRTIGALGEVLHCYIFSNSIEVFKNSYQASLSANLLELLTKEAEQDRPFLAAQEDFFFTADEDAPIDLTTHEVEQFELRNDITALRLEIKSAVGRERTLLRDRCRAEIRTLSALQLDFKRAQYFDQIDRYRARGMPTDGIRSKALEDRTSLLLNQSGAAIAQFLQGPDMMVYRVSNIRWMELLLDNLRGRGHSAASSPPAGRSQFQCLLCEAVFTTSSSLTRHTGAIHEDQFLRPLKCPPCARSGKHVEVTGSLPWSIHCAAFHGPEFTPKPVAKAIVCFCGSRLSPSMLANHLNRNRAKHTGNVSCKECENSPNYEDIDEWLGHVQIHQPDSCRPFRYCLLCGTVCQDMHRHLDRTHTKQFERPFQCPKCGQEVEGRDAWEAHVFDLHATRRTPPPPPHDEREPDAVCDTSLVIGDGNHRFGIDNIFSNMASDTGQANVEAWKLLGGLLSQIDSLGWSDSECLSWMRQNVQAMQSGSPTGRVTKNGKKHSAEETLGLEKIKRPRLFHGLDDRDLDTAVGEDGSMAEGDMDDDDDGGEWDADDNSDCSSDTSCDDDNENMATIFQALKERAACKIASRATTEKGPSVTTSDTALFQEPPPPYASAVNSPLAPGGYF